MTDEAHPAGDRRPPPPPWENKRHPPRRAPRAPLDRARIVEVGLRILDAEGADALSLRRLAAELGVGTMSLYWHVRDKAELLDLIGGAVLETIDVPPAVGDWRAQLRDVHHAMLAAVLRHPNAADLMIGRARYGAAGITLFERLLGILEEAGLPPAEAFDAYQSLYLYLLGYLATIRRTPAFRQAQLEGQQYLRSLDSAHFPSIARVAPVIGARSPADAFEIGLDVVIEGIAVRLIRGDPRQD